MDQLINKGQSSFTKASPGLTFNIFVFTYVPQVDVADRLNEEDKEEDGDHPTHQETGSLTFTEVEHVVCVLLCRSKSKQVYFSQ